MLRYRGEKMSKSLGNLVLVRDLLRSYPGDAIRHYLVSHHYRGERDFDEADVEASVLAVSRLRLACRLAEEVEPLAPALADPADLVPPVAEHRARFLAAMDNDLGTPAAIPELHALAAIATGTDDPRLRAQAGWMVRELGARILGLRLATTAAVSVPEPPEEVPA
jgi:cysteinyl-tRNA synthetase